MPLRAVEYQLQW